MCTCRSVGMNEPLDFREDSGSSTKRGYHDWLNAIIKFTLLALTILLAIFLPQIKPTNTDLPVLVCSSIIIGNYAVLKSMVEFQKVFMVFGLARNPAYAWIADNTSFRTCLNLFATVLKPLLCLVYVSMIAIAEEQRV